MGARTITTLESSLTIEKADSCFFFFLFSTSLKIVLGTLCVHLKILRILEKYI